MYYILHSYNKAKQNIKEMVRESTFTVFISRPMQLKPVLFKGLHYTSSPKKVNFTV